MKESLLSPKVEDIIVAVAKDKTPDGDEGWYVFMINNKDVMIEGVLVSSNGYGMKNDEKVKTSMLRHFLDEMEPKSFKKVEAITEEVFGLFNQYWVSFYQDKKMYDKKFIFPAESISEKNYTMIPVLDKMGIMIQ